jgi:hypothetical protein
VVVERLAPTGTLPTTNTTKGSGVMLIRKRLRDMRGLWRGMGAGVVMMMREVVVVVRGLMLDDGVLEKGETWERGNTWRGGGSGQ